MPLASGWSAASSAWPAVVKLSMSGIGAEKLFDRVMISKSANLTLRVTVRPATSARSIRAQA